MAAARGAPMICERCGHEREPREHLYGTTSYCAHMPEDCIANLRADLARCNADASTIENHMRERLAELEAELEAERARSVSIRDHTLEEAARVADEHWPENGHVHDVGVLSCQATISALIRRRRGSIPRAFVDEEELKAERGRSWEGWQQAEHYERLSFDFITGAMPSYAERIDHEKFGRRKAEERAARAEAALTNINAIRNRMNAAEAQCAVMRAVLEEAETLDVEPRAHIADALATAAGYDLLTAVRRLMEALDQAAAEAHSRCPDGGPFTACPHAHCQAAAVARADPALAGLRGAP